MSYNWVKRPKVQACDFTAPRIEDNRLQTRESEPLGLIVRSVSNKSRSVTDDNNKAPRRMEKRESNIKCTWGYKKMGGFNVTL